LFGEEGEAFGRHVGEAALHLIGEGLLIDIDLHQARPQHGHERFVPGHDAEIALHARRIDLIDLAGEEFALGRDEGKAELSHCRVSRLGQDGRWRP
jgi:hypothetical protein